MSISVRIPQITDHLYAIELFYRKTELSTGDIRDLFRKEDGTRIGSGRALRLKELAREAQRETKAPIYDPQSVNTEIAYKTWGIDIHKLERRYKKLREYAEVTS